jgi:hypothetical protein
VFSGYVSGYAAYLFGAYPERVPKNVPFVLKEPP